MEMDQLYTELILEHNQDKRNKRELSEFYCFRTWPQSKLW